MKIPLFVLHDLNPTDTGVSSEDTRDDDGMSDFEVNNFSATSLRKYYDTASGGISLKNYSFKKTLLQFFFS